MKKVFTTIAMATVFTFGATFAHAGLLLSDGPQTCADTQKDGIIIAGRGILQFFTQLEGIIIAGTPDPAPPPCVETDGIIIAG